MQIFDIGVGWNSATSTATISTGESYALTAYEQGKHDAQQKAYLEAIKNPYQPMQQYKEPFIQFQTTPSKLIYKVGEPFETAGFKVVYVDIYGKGTDITSEIELKVNSTKIYDGYKFTQVGKKTVDCYHNGKRLNGFKITVIENDDSILDSGNYYMQINGKYLYPVLRGAVYWLELWDEKPANPFYIKLVDHNKDSGPMYYIMYNDAYIMLPTSKDGEQLQSAKYTSHGWRINKYTKFCTIRDYGNQKLIVNASGEKYDNGTKVIVWSHTDSAPEHAKITLIKTD